MPLLLHHGGLEGNPLVHHQSVQLDPAHPSQGDPLHLLTRLVEEGRLGRLAGHLLVDRALVEALKVRGDECLHLGQLVQTSSGAGLHEDAVDGGVLDHGQVGGVHLLLLLGQGEEGGGEEKEGYQGQPHLCPQRGNEQKIMRPTV